MAKYYFHTREGEQLDEDLDGVDLPDIQAVRREGTLAAREMVAELVLRGELIDGKCFEVADENGNVVAHIPFKSVVI